MKSQHTIYVAAVVLLLAGGMGASRAPVREFTPQADSLEKQIADDIFGAVRANAEAESYMDWQTGGFTPADVFHNLRSLKNSEAWKAACAALASLQEADLSLFDDELSKGKNAKDMACAATLHARIQGWWDSRRALMHAQKVERLLPSGKALEETPSLPNDEIHVDVEKEPILTNGHLKPGQIALTFDDGPHPTRTARILEILKAAGVRANFFEVGEMSQAHPELSQKVVADGHIVGSHSMTHANLPALPLSKAQLEISQARQAVAADSGASIPFFRFPFGAHNAALDTFVKAEGMSSFFWNMDSLDWKYRDPSVLLSHVNAELDRAKGGIILFHDIQEQTVIALPHVISELSKRNFSTYVFVPH